MPRARRKRDRLHQIANWLRAAFPTPHPVALRIRAIDRPGDPIVSYGYCERTGKRFVIHLEARLRWRDAVEILIHEWAHAFSWPHANVERHHSEHSDEWGLAYARIYRAFYDELGDEMADGYPVRSP